MKEYWIMDQNGNKIAQFTDRYDPRIKKVLDKMPTASLYLINDDGGQQLIKPKLK